jgi:hypothetical protein
MDKLKLCAGCRNDFYNDKNPLGVKRCWSFESAKVVTRYRIGWWTQPTQSGAYAKVLTLTCHHAPGQYAQHVEMPECFPGKAEVERGEPVNAGA